MPRGGRGSRLSGSPARQQLRPWQDSLHGTAAGDGTRRRKHFAPGRHQDPELQADEHHPSDGARQTALRLGTDRARAAAIARAELACIRRAEMRAAKISVRSASVNASASDDDEGTSGVSVTPWISPQYHRTSVGVRTTPDPDWDALWDSGVTAAVAATRSPRSSAQTLVERSRRSATRATAALLRAQNGDTRAPVPYGRISSRTQLEVDPREASLLALEKRVAEAKKALERRERSSQTTSDDTRAGLPRRTRSAGDEARTSMAAIKRVAQRRVVSVELTEDSLEQEELWRNRRLQVQQAQLHSKAYLADQATSSPGGWLGSSSLYARANGERDSGLLIQAQSAAQESIDADERETYQTDRLRQKESPLQHKLHGHGSTESRDSSRRPDTQTQAQPDSEDDSDDFASGDGLYAEPETTPSLKLSALLSRDMHCPNFHDLLAFETPIDGYKCDKCGAIVRAGSLMRSCRQCEHDVCGECVRSSIQFQKMAEKPAHLSMPDEVGVTTKGTCSVHSTINVAAH